MFVAMFGTFGTPDLVILSVIFGALLISFQMPKMIVQILQVWQRLRVKHRISPTFHAIYQDQEDAKTVELKRKILIKQLFVIIGIATAVIALLNLLQ